MAAPDSTSPAARQNGPLIDPSALMAALQSAGPPVVLDVRWTLAGADPASFEQGHVPGAVFADLDRDLAAPPGEGGRHPLPDAAGFATYLAGLGIAPDTPVVVGGQRDASIAARAWWLLRWRGVADVRVLDGGFEAWKAAGLPVETCALEHSNRGRPVDVSAYDGVPVGHATPTVDADGAADLGAEAGSVLLDARAPERYRGEVEPMDPVPGHIPGAVNLPLAEIHAPDGRLLPADELRERLAAAGVRPGVPVAASCGSGVTACALILAGAVAGLDLALYPGSYSGWCALARPVETS